MEGALHSLEHYQGPYERRRIMVLVALEVLGHRISKVEDEEGLRGTCMMCKLPFSVPKIPFEKRTVFGRALHVRCPALSPFDEEDPPARSEERQGDGPGGDFPHR